jgi:3D (Asp-Asp-Asp) domain-containing protein
MTTQTASVRARRWFEVMAFGACLVLTVSTAAIAKRAGLGPALVALDTTSEIEVASEPAVELIAPSQEPGIVIEPVAAVGVDEVTSETWYGEDGVEYHTPEPGHMRYFDGRPIRPVRTVWMVVTAYSPDHRSCGKWADGKTASMKSVWTNAMESVAADTRLLPFGSLLSVPGYAEDRVVPVFDRGGAIKGARLDVLYPTHEIARKWGRQRLPVTIWEYADED